MANRRWIMVDSSSVLHRCFHGYVAPKSGTWDGRTTDVAALAGYVEYIHKLRKEFEFEHIIHVLDASTASHYRARLYPQYKAQRDETDPFLAAQKQLLPKVLAALGEPVVVHHGYEADDVLGTLVSQAKAEGDAVMIMTKDKDLMQLVSENVAVVMYEKDERQYNVHRFYETDQDVVGKLGIRPDQVADYLALIGDTVDNIPGLPGVGPGTASKWLADYGDIDTLLTQVDSIKSKRADPLRHQREDLMLYRQLTRVVCDVPNVSLAQASELPLADEPARHKVLDLLGWPRDWTWEQPVPRQAFVPRRPGP